MVRQKGGSPRGYQPGFAFSALPEWSNVRVHGPGKVEVLAFVMR